MRKTTFLERGVSFLRWCLNMFEEIIIKVLHLIVKLNDNKV